MINFASERFDGCRRIYIAANTPSFMMKKMRIERSVIDLHLKFSKDELINLLKSAIEKDAGDFIDKLSPMILMAALSLKGDPTVFKDFVEKNNHRWVAPVARHLSKSAKSTMNTNLIFDSSSFTSPTDRSRTKSSSTRILFEN